MYVILKVEIFHQVNNLLDTLDESMLLQVRLTVHREDVLSDVTGKEMAEIEALVEEAAEVVDTSHQKNPNYYSTYTIRYLLKRQDDGSWRFCEGDVQNPS
ncbi:hypothetical protein L2E82_29548 [Cichorium intybus]|uniref:Uncharacterized protein n=1 Tax=Cichorium intybus TaxID=13427 RepID=A0ACB9CY91_CICIN|nr:hypothetical protein L2E82_29548 [Cichorium intybus]